jgi:subtilisin family serine protease
MRVFLGVYFLLVPFFLSSQSGMNNALKMRLTTRATAEESYNILVKGNIVKLNQRASEFGIVINYNYGSIASINCALNIVPQLLDEKIIDYAELTEPRKRPLNDTMIYRNRIKGVKEWTSPLPKAYDGDSILMGIIDTGIDFNHPDFKNANGKTRIQYIWDQKQSSGSSVPSPFNYGIEWRKGQIDSGLCNHSDIAYYGHGTHVAGIAAGNGKASNSHEGCASAADIVVVGIDFNNAGPTIADAVQYIVSKATAAGKPFVINASLGDYYGSHDATDLEAKLIENMIADIPGRAMVAACGNAGNFKFHVKTQPNGDTLFSWIRNSNNQYSYWCYGDTLQVKNLKFSVGANRFNFSDVGKTSFKNYDYALQVTKNDTLYRNGNRIGIIRSSAAINPYGIYELFIKIEPDSTGMYWRIETTGNGVHDAWNFDFISSGLPGPVLHPRIAKYAMPNVESTMVSSFQCSDEVITVANYNNLTCYYDVNGVLRYTGEIGGELAQNSSKGPTRDGRYKPDVTATGHGVLSALPLSIISSLLVNTPSVVAQGSMHVLSGGSSAASPVVAGLAALYLQRHPTATNKQVRDAIRFCAYSDDQTSYNLPDFHWGFGKLDGKATMTCGENTTNGFNQHFSEKLLSVFPNPFHDQLHIDFKKPVKARIQLYGSDGRLLVEEPIDAEKYTFSSEKLPPGYKGLLLMRVSGSNVSEIYKLIRN